MADESDSDSDLSNFMDNNQLNLLTQFSGKKSAAVSPLMQKNDMNKNKSSEPIIKGNALTGLKSTFIDLTQLSANDSEPEVQILGYKRRK